MSNVKPGQWEVPSQEPSEVAARCIIVMHEWMGNAYHEKLNNESSLRLLSLLYGGYDILRLNDGLLTSALHVQVRVVDNGRCLLAAGRLLSLLVG